MQRIYSTFIEMTAAGVFMIPIFCIYGKYMFHSIKRTMMYILFGLYLTAVLALIGYCLIKAIKS